MKSVKCFTKKNCFNCIIDLINGYIHTICVTNKPLSPLRLGLQPIPLKRDLNEF